MIRRQTMRLAGAVLAGTLWVNAWAQTTIDVQYPLGFIFDKTMAEVKTEFEKRNPNIKVNFRAAYKEYEDAAQTALRDAITKNLPDVSFQAMGGPFIVCRRLRFAGGFKFRIRNIVSVYVFPVYGGKTPA